MDEHIFVAVFGAGKNKKSVCEPCGADIISRHSLVEGQSLHAIQLKSLNELHFHSCGSISLGNVNKYQIRVARGHFARTPKP